MRKRKIYMDYNATTPLHPEVKKAMEEAMDLFGNASSLHELGRRARGRIEEARENIAAFIGSSAEEIIFAGSGSEANNTILNIFSCSCPSSCGADTHKREIVTSSIEHPCVLETSKCLNERGTPVKFISVDRFGKIDAGQAEESITDKTGLVSIMMANNEIGTIMDVKKIAGLAHKRGAYFHTDAVQAVGKIPVNVDDLNVDFLSFSGHKIYGPKGIGVIYVRKDTPFCPLIRGGHQEKGRRAGTENTLGIIGLSRAIDMRRIEMKDEQARLSRLKARLRESIEKNIPDIQFNGHPTDCLAGTLNVSFEGAEGEAILLYLDLEGIAVSTGSACASGSLDPSHVLLATGLPAEKAHGSIRISIGRDNTEKEVDYVAEKLKDVIEKVRGMSSAYKGRK